MKQILLTCSLLVAILGFSSVQHVSAQAVTAASFTVKVNQMDAFLAAGDLTSAKATFDNINVMMKSVLAVTKNSIRSAATPADQATYNSIIRNQISIYKVIYQLKEDLATNRTAIHTQLVAFDATIY